MGKNIPIVFAFNDTYRSPAGACFTSLLETKNDNTFYDIFILYSDGLSTDTREIFEQFYKVKYSGFNFTWIQINTDFIKNAPVGWASVETYFRLFIPDYIQGYEKILWADCDFIFMKDISKFYEIDLGDADIAMPRDIKNREEVCIVHAYYPEIKRDYIYTTCFMLINARKWREKNMTDKFLAAIEKYKSRIKLFDLDVLNLTCESIIELPFNSAILSGYFHDKNYIHQPWVAYGVDEIEAGIRDPYIIHFAGIEDPKPWKKENPFIPEYKIWLDNVRKSPFWKKYSKKRELAHKIKALISRRIF